MSHFSFKFQHFSLILKLQQNGIFWNQNVMKNVATFSVLNALKVSKNCILEAEDGQKTSIMNIQLLLIFAGLPTKDYNRE